MILRSIGEYWVEGFHLSRVLNANTYRESGVEILSIESYLDRMDKVFELLGYTEKYRKQLYDIFIKFNQTSGSGRIGRLSLFYPDSDYALYKHDREGLVDYYAETVGGEYAKMALWDNTSARIVLEKLQSCGDKVITKVRYQLKSLFSKTTEISKEKVLSQIVYASLFADVFKSLPNDFIIISQIEKSIPADKVIYTRAIE
jgi:hypothetical protein